MKKLPLRLTGTTLIEKIPGNIKSGIYHDNQSDSVLIYLITGGEVFGIGGLAKYIIELANYLASNGYHTKIISKMGKIFPVRFSANITLQNKIIFKSKENYSLYFMMQHLPNLLSVILCTTRLAIDITQEKTYRKILHIHDPSSSLLIAFIIRIIFKLPIIIHIHGFPLKEQKIKLSKKPGLITDFIWFLTLMWHKIAVSLIKVSNAYVIVNNYEIKIFYELCGILPDRIRVISSAIDVRIHQERLLNITNARKFLGLSNSKNDIVLGYVGGLRTEKNIEIILIALRELLKDHPEVSMRLVIIGDGPCRIILEKIVKKYNLESKVLFFGFIPDAYQYLNAIDIFILASISEGSPYSLIEAMVAGKAIIASDIPAIREMVENGKEALLFDPYSPEKLKDAILKLYYNPELRRELGENAKKKAKQYDINTVFSKIDQIYKRV